MDVPVDVNHVSCDLAAAQIEAAAMGEPVPAAMADHISRCTRCAARLDLARRIDALLRTREVAAPPAAFTTTVLTRVRQERWRTEQVVDFGFNIAVAAGLVLILSGLLGFAWQLGALPGIDRAIALGTEGLTLVARRAAADMRLLMMGMLLVTTAVGVWWWAEEDVVW
jgi:hypothetical protein